MASITTPVTVVAQPYDTSGNGGRKLVRLSNGWLVAAAYDSANLQTKFYKSSDNGQTWNQLTFITLNASAGFAIASKDTTVYFICAATASTTNSFVKFDATTVTNTDQASTKISIDAGQNTFGAQSLAIAPDGTLHAAWASKNSTYPNSFNIRYRKGTINGDGSVTWGSVTQVTKYNSSGVDLRNPCVVIQNNYPFILAEHANSTVNRIHVYTTSFTTQEIGSTDPNWGSKIVYNGSAFAQSNPCAVVDNAGVIHVVWIGKDATYNANNIFYSKSDDEGASWSPYINLTKVTNTSHPQAYPSIGSDSSNRLYVFWHGYDPAVSTLHFNIRKIVYDGLTWGSIETITSNTNTGGAIYPSVMEKDSAASIGLIWKDEKSGSVKYASITLNQQPSLTLTSPTDNQTLSEGSTYTLAGSASDPDNGNAVTVKYAINGGTARNITSAISDGSTAIPFTKTLTFTNGRLYDGETDVSGPLAENTTYTVSVYAVDDQGGTSTAITRSFTVILNRPPTINLDPYNANQTGVSELEALTFAGTVTDPENDTVSLTVAVNGGTPVTLKSGVASGTAFSYSIPVSALVFGANTIVFTATDAKGASTTKTLTVNKTGTFTPVKTAVVRYVITPPLGSAAEIAAWVQREDGDLTVDAAASIVGSADPENFIALTKTASVPLKDGTIIEDEFVGAVAQPGAKVALKLMLSRDDTSSTAAVKKIMGGIG
jgi:hypothetical protein